jgi:hypothetical protein
MPDIATVAFAVDSTALDRARGALKELNLEAGKTDALMKQFQARAKDSNLSVDELAKNYVKAQKGQQDLQKETASTNEALKKTTDAAKQASAAKKELNDSLRTLSRSATLLPGPLGMIARGLGGFSSGGFTSATVGIYGTVAAFAALSAVTYKAVEAYAKFEAQQARVANALAASGRGGSGLTAGLVESSVRGNAASGTQSTDDLRATSASILRFRVVSEENFDAVMKAAKDLAATGFADLKGAADAIGKSMQNPIAAGEAFTAMGLKLSDATQNAANEALGLGNKAEAARIILKAWSDQVSGSDARAAETLSGAWGRFGNELGKTAENVGGAVAAMLLLKEMLDGLAGAMKGYNDELDRNRKAQEDFKLTGKFRPPGEFGKAPSGMSADLGFSDISPNKLGAAAGLGDIGKVSETVLLVQERTARAAVEAAKLREAWGGVTDEEAKALQTLQDQIAIASARTEQERMIVQHAIAERTARLEGATATNAILQADMQRQLVVAQINASLDQQLQSLQEQAEVLQGATQVEQARIKAAQEYDKAVKAGGDSLKAGAVAAQTIANARQQQDAQEMASAEAQAAQASQQRANSNARAAQNAQREADEMDRIIAANREKARIDAFIPSGIQYSELYTRKDGGKSQFNPEGYTSLTKQAGDALWAAMKSFGEGNFEQVADLSNSGFTSFRPTSSFLSRTRNDALNYSVDNAFGGGLGAGGAIGSLLGPDSGLASDIPEMVQNTAAMLSRLTGLLPEDQQIGSIRGQIGILQQQPATLAREELLKQLNDRLAQLTEASEENTDALRTSADPLFSQGHEYLNSLRIGYYKAATGLEGIVGGSGGTDSTEVRMMLTPGEHLKVTPKGQANDNSRTVTQNITFNMMEGGSTPTDRFTRRQRVQGYTAALARAAA